MGISTTSHTVSFRKACPPRPTAKNEYRQLSCSVSPGKVSPSARNAIRVVPLSSAATVRMMAPVVRPTVKAVPVHLVMARRHVGMSVPLNLTRSGSVARPRDALSAKP